MGRRTCGLPVTDSSARIGHRAQAERQDLSAAAPFPELTAFIKVLIMPPTEVAAPVFAPVTPTFTQAAVRFAVSFAALIGLSLLLAGL